MSAGELGLFVGDICGEGMKFVVGRSEIFRVHFYNLHRDPSSPVMKTILSYDVGFGIETERSVLVY